MTIANAILKEQILAELDHLSEYALVKTLAYVQSLRRNFQMASMQVAQGQVDKAALANILANALETAP